MRLSVVIPTRERPQLLADCLETLAGQPQPPGGFEVLVVDDGSREPLDRAVLPFAEAGLPVRCIRQRRAGLNAARNRGVEESRGELIAFLDDDTLVCPGWPVAVHEGFETERCQVLGGRITLQMEAEPPRWLTRKRHSYLSEYDLGPEPLQVSSPPLPFGANFAVSRLTLQELEPFRPGLDRVGPTLISNGETELLRRVLEAGGRIVYWPAAKVLHRVPAERLTKPWFRRRAFAQGVSDVRSDPTNGRPGPVRIAREVARAGRALPILGRRLVEGRGSFDAVIWLTYCRGRIDELRRSERSGV